MLTVWRVFSGRARRTLENRIDVDDNRCGKLEVKLREAQALLQETENKYEEVSTDNLFLKG